MYQFIKDALSGLRQFLATGSSLKMMENCFYFTLKVFFVLKIFNFFSWLFGDVEKLLDRKNQVNFKIMTSQLGKQTIAVHILLNISRSKGNQTMKTGQLTEYKMRNIFLEKSYTNVVEKLLPDPFVKNQN